MALLTSVVCQEAIYMTSLVVMVHVFVFLLYQYITQFQRLRYQHSTFHFKGSDVRLTSTPLVAILLLWCVHSALFRSSEILLDGDGANYVGAVQACMAMMLLWARVTERLTHLIVFMVVSFTLNVVPMHDTNIFHMGREFVYFRCVYACVVYWGFAIESLHTLEFAWRQVGSAATAIATEKKGSGPAAEIRGEMKQTIHGLYILKKQLQLRDTLRTLWVLAIPDSGLLVCTFVYVVYAGLQTVAQLPCILSYITDDEIQSMGSPLSSPVTGKEAGVETAKTVDSDSEYSDYSADATEHVV